MLVVEKYLDVLGGHEHTQIAAIRGLLGDRPMGVVTGRDGAHPQGAIAAFHPVLSTRAELNTSPERCVARDADALAAILASVDPSRADAVLVPSAQTHDLRVALRLPDRAPRPPKIHLRVLLDREIAGLNDGDRAALGAAIASGRIVLLTETDTLAAHFRARYGLACHDTALCLPCAQMPARAAPDTPRPDALRRRIGVLGAFRTEKGVLMLPAIIRHLRRALAAAPEAPDADLVIQKSRPRWKIKDLRREAAFRLAAGVAGPRARLTVSLRPVKLSDGDFAAMLMSVDLLLVPYRLDTYRHRGSGIVLDGVAARKPIVHTDGMGMTELLCHGNAEAAAEDPAQYSAHVVTMLRDLDRYAAGADRAATELDRRIARAGALLRTM